MKEFFVSVLVVLFVLGVVIFAAFHPKIYITFISVEGSSLNEEQIKNALQWQYRYNPLRVGKEYQISMGSPAPIVNIAKQNYESFVWVTVKEYGFLVDKTKVDGNNWRMVLAKEKNGNWKIVADKLSDTQGVGDWY